MPSHFPAKNWTKVDVKVKMQGNLYDCGILSCMFGYILPVLELEVCHRLIKLTVRKK